MIFVLASKIHGMCGFPPKASFLGSFISRNPGRRASFWLPSPLPNPLPTHNGARSWKLVNYLPIQEGGRSREGDVQVYQKNRRGTASAPWPLCPKTVGYKLETITLKAVFLSWGLLRAVKLTCLYFFFYSPIKGLTARKYKSHRLLLCWWQWRKGENCFVAELQI